MNIVKLQNLSSCDFTCNGAKVKIKKSSSVIDSSNQSIPNPYNAIVGTIPTMLKEGGVVIEVFSNAIAFWEQTSCDHTVYAWSSVAIVNIPFNGHLQDIGTNISFIVPTTYNDDTAPGTGNFTENLSGAKLGVTQKIYHDDSTPPSFPVTWTQVGSGGYNINTLNIIYVEYVSPIRVEYRYLT